MQFVIVAHVTDGFGHVIKTRVYGPFRNQDAAEAWATAHLLRETAAGQPVQYEISLLHSAPNA